MAGLTRAQRKELQYCKSCEYGFSKEKTQCPKCLTFNVDVKEDPANAEDDGTQLLTDVDSALVRRIQTGPWDPVFGSHIEDNGDIVIGPVTDSVTLIGGVPGAGKSTLALQLASAVATSTKREVLIFAFEESKGQVKARAKRLALPSQNLIRIVPMGTAVDLNKLLVRHNPAALVGDSLQKMFGDLQDQTEFCETLKEHCIERQMPALLISHVNKGEELAGLMNLQHAVDTTLLFNVDIDQVRGISTIKNRNGPSGVTVHFNMTERGLVYRDPEEDDEDSEDDEEDDDE